MAEQLPPQNPDNLLSKALGVRTVGDEISHTKEHLHDYQQSSYLDKLMSRGLSRWQARQYLNRIIFQSELRLEELLKRDPNEKYINTGEY